MVRTNHIKLFSWLEINHMLHDAIIIGVVFKRMEYTDSNVFCHIAEIEILIPDDIAIDKREFLDENGVNIFSKKSGEKTVEERIKTSRTLKIKNNKWNQVDYTEDFSNDKRIFYWIYNFINNWSFRIY